jgi:hypothetical protein
MDLREYFATYSDRGGGFRIQKSIVHHRAATDLSGGPWSAVLLSGCDWQNKSQCWAPTMSSEKSLFRWKLKARETRLLFYLLVVLAVAAWKFIPRPWHPSLTLKTPHHLIYSTASKQQTDGTAHAMELLYVAYSNHLGRLTSFQREHARLQVKLFRDRAEFRRINPGLSWAEAYYREPYCWAYYSADEINPCHWMLHEGVHQLNHEVAQLKLEKWLDEGLAEYFSTSRLQDNQLAVGRTDPNTYPVWWIDELATSPALEENIRNGSVIPLRAIVTNRGGPSMNRHFNLYYLHWWTLTHFVFENPNHREHALALVQRGGGLEAFEELIGPVDQVQSEWHAHVRELKARLSGADLDAAKTKGAQGDPLPISESR